jgi:hypothetical protein
MRRCKSTSSTFRTKPMNKKLLCMFMIATLILPTCGKRITKPLIEAQSSLDSMSSQPPAKKGEETWRITSPKTGQQGKF